jgi:2-polyprenyl-3-methyl-5-hydroxy-6-metoxy-1,4-benzoquinol methylase
MVPSNDPMGAEYVDRRHTQTEDRYAADDLETMQGAKRYASHLFGLFKPFVGRHVLEVGSGIGTMSERLVDTAELVVGIEPNPVCAVQVKERMRGNARFSLRECLIEECDAAELASHRFDTVFCVNVLEHIEDDVAALRTFDRTLVPGGHVLVWVPAVPSAYGPLDAELGHHRRYTRAALTRAFTQAGLDVVMVRYSNPIGLLGWYYNAHVGKSRTHSPSQVKVFEMLVAPWALPLERLLPPPIGLSLAIVGRKRG